MLASCKVLTVEEDRAIRARQGGALDAPGYVAGMWDDKALPAFRAAAVPLDTLASAIAQDVDRAGGTFGRRAGEGSAWTFVLEGAGRVVSVDSTSRRGQVMVALPNWPSGQSARFQIGPVVEGSAVRDALPFVTFDDFADQLVFADVGRALTARALAGVRPVAAGLRPGQTVRFVGIANIRYANAPLIVTPISLKVGRAG
ncbi:DUF2291 family protein [Sphingomonas gellani]|nr:DUF2291 domain-containing protein [Sphingomonas gellani]